MIMKKKKCTHVSSVVPVANHFSFYSSLLPRDSGILLSKMQNGQRDACRLPLLWGHAWRFPFEAGVLKFLSNHLLFLKRVGRKWRGRERSGQEGTPREGKITISIMTARWEGNGGKL